MIIFLRRGFCMLFLDALLAASLLASVWGFFYLRPQSGVSAPVLSETIQALDEKTAPILDRNSGADSSSLIRTRVSLDPQDWHEKFADHFTDQIVSTDTSYTSPDLAIQISRHSYDTSRLDQTGDGSHKRYGTSVAYVLADIYVGDITCLQTAFAQNTYGVGYSEMLSDMAGRLGAVLAVNGDSYSNNRHRDNGTIIRNGIIYRSKKTDVETCVLNWDGTMHIYQPDEIKASQLIRGEVL